MSSSLNPGLSNEKLLKNRTSCLIVLISICYLLSILFVYFTCEELYKYETFIVGKCHVNNIDLTFLRNSFFPRWNLTISYRNKTINRSIIQTIGIKSDRLAWIKAKKYQMNSTYECYRSFDEETILQWNWQWKKPNQSEIILFSLLALLFFSCGFGLIKFKQHYQIQLKKIQLFNEQQPTAL